MKPVARDFVFIPAETVHGARLQGLREGLLWGLPIGALFGASAVVLWHILSIAWLP